MCAGCLLCIIQSPVTAPYESDGIAAHMNGIMFAYKNIVFLSSIVIGHLVFTHSKNNLLDNLQIWWHDFLVLASKYLPEEELHKRISSVKCRPSLPFIKLEKRAFH